jgi:hypothetical protein
MLGRVMLKNKLLLVSWGRAVTMEVAYTLQPVHNARQISNQRPHVASKLTVARVYRNSLLAL